MTSFLATEGRSHRVVTRTTRRRVQVKTPTYTVTATAYQAVAGQTDAEPFVTADNSRIKPHYTSKTRWLALSQDLLAQGGGKFQYGDKVRVQGISPQLDGVYTVHDTMNKRHRHCIDILTHTSEKLDIFTKDVQLRLARAAPLASQLPRQSREARRARAFNKPPPGAKRVDYFASAIL